MKLLRTIALDPSDTFVFDVPAEPGDWAVSGAFRFCDRDPAELSGKDRSAFRGGFLGVQSWGWSTLAQIVHATEDDRRTVVELLARQLVERFGAPDLAIARLAAEEEVAFAQSLCSHPISTLIAACWWNSLRGIWSNGSGRRILQPRALPRKRKSPLHNRSVRIPLAL